MEICRLPRRPHLEAGLKLEPMAALVWDATIMRASREHRLRRAMELLEELGEKDMLGTAGLRALALLDYTR